MTNRLKNSELIFQNQEEFSMFNQFRSSAGLRGIQHDRQTQKFSKVKRNSAKLIGSEIQY